MAIQIKRFNWRGTPSAWQTVQAWRQQRGSMVAQFQADANAASGAFASAQNSLSTGISSIAAQAMIQRIQKEISASAQSQLGQLNLLA